MCLWKGKFLQKGHFCFLAGKYEAGSSEGHQGKVSEESLLWSLVGMDGEGDAAVSYKSGIRKKGEINP